MTVELATWRKKLLESFDSESIKLYIVELQDEIDNFNENFDDWFLQLLQAGRDYCEEILKTRATQTEEMKMPSDRRNPANGN